MNWFPVLIASAGACAIGGWAWFLFVAVPWLARKFEPWDRF